MQPLMPCHSTKWGSCPPEATRPSPTTHTSVYAYKLDSVTRLARIHQIIIENDVNAPWKISCRRPFWHLLNIDPLVISKGTQTELHLQWVAIFVCLWRDGGCGH